MVSVSSNRLLPIVILMVGIAALASASVAIPMEDSEAAATTEWYSYGHHIVLRDRSFDPAAYRSIEWIVSDSPIIGTDDGIRIAGDPSDRYSATLDLDPSDFPFYDVKPLFVKENATMADGTVESIEFSINVNPIANACYFHFMYDDVRTYMYEEVTSKTRVAVGVDDIIQVPEDPYMPGYTFEGWFNDRECTSRFDPMMPVTFTDVRQIYVYPKWTASGSPVAPGEEMRFITIQPVDGLHIDCDGMTASNGSSFSFTASVSDGYRFDLAELRAVTSSGTELARQSNADGSYTFTMNSVSEDTTVFLTGYVQYVRVTASFDDVATVGVQEWILRGSSLYLPLRSTIGGDVAAKVFMGDADISGTAFIDGVVRIGDVTGNVIIVAESVPKAGPSESDGGIPWPAIAAGAIAGIVIVAAASRLHSRKP